MVLAVGCWTGLPGGRRSCDAVAAGKQLMCSFVGAGLTDADDDFAAAAAAAAVAFGVAAPPVDDGRRGFAVVRAVGHAVAGCAIADDKAAAAAEIRGGTRYHSGLDCPTLDSHCCRTIHWIEALDQLLGCETGQAGLP